MLGRVAVVLILGWSLRAAAEPRKPLLAGAYEIAKMKIGDHKELDFTDFMIEQMHVIWGRNLLVFDGTKITIMSQLLDHDEKGHVVACEASATGGIEWTAKGLKVPAKLQGDARLRTFTQLTGSKHDSYEYHCNVALDATTFVVEPGDEPRLRTSEGVLTLRKTTVDVDWTKHAP